METERITIEKTEYEQLRELEKSLAALKAERSRLVSERSRLTCENRILQDKADMLAWLFP